MPVDRSIITNRHWAKIEPHCLGKKSDPGRTGGDARLFLEGVFWIARTGAHWRDLPIEFGKWNSVYRRFRDWGVRGVLERIFNALSDSPDMEMAMIDVTIVDLPPGRPSFITRVLEVDRRRFRVWQAPGAVPADCSSARRASAGVWFASEPRACRGRASGRGA